MGSAVFKTVSRALVPFWVGSIPMHLRHSLPSPASFIPRFRALGPSGILVAVLTLLDLVPYWGFCAALLAEDRVVIFSGHTARPDRKGKGRGAKSASGVHEFRFNDSVATFLEREKPPCLDFVVIPATRNVSLRSRVALARRLNADIIVEIHHDSVHPRIYEKLVRARYPDPLIDRYRGFSLHVFPDEASIALAAAIEARMIAAGLEFSDYHQEDIPGERMKLVPGTKAVYERPNLHLPRTSTVPTVIVECGCIANPEEERLLADPAYQETVAHAIRQGIEDCRESRRRVSAP